MSSAVTHLYIIATMKDELPKAPVKVGLTNNPAARLKTLQTASPSKLVIFCTFLIPGGKFGLVIEQAIHECLEEFHLSGEWFSAHPLAAAASACEVLQAASDDFPNELPLERMGVLENLRQMTRYANFLKDSGRGFDDKD